MKWVDGSAAKAKASGLVNALERALGGKASWPQVVLPSALALAAIAISVSSAPNWMIGLLGAGLALVTISIAVIDWHRFIIPDSLNLAGLILALVHAAVLESFAGDDVLWNVGMAMVRGLVLAGLFLAIRIGYARFRGRQGLGLGDVKLAAVAGAWLDWPMIPVALQLAVLAALSIYVVRQIVVRRPISATGRLPFGVFLAPTIWVCWWLELGGFGAF